MSNYDPPTCQTVIIEAPLPICTSIDDDDDDDVVEITFGVTIWDDNDFEDHTIWL